MRIRSFASGSAFRVALCMILGVLACTGRVWAGAAGADAYERWYVVQMEGKKAGHMVTREEPDGENIKTRTYLQVEIKRGKLKIPISTESVWVETRDGKPLSLKSTTQLGALPTVKTYTFDGPKIHVSTKIGGQTSKSEIDRPEGEWLTPAAAHRFMDQKLAEGSKEFSVLTIEDDPGGGLSAVKSKRTVVEKGTVEVFGKVVPAIKWKTEMDKYPGIELTEFVDERGESVRSETDVGGIKMVQLLADKDLALSPAEAPELLDSTLVTPDRPIRDARNVKSGAFVLSVPKGEMPALPMTPAQRVEVVDKQTLRVIVGGTPAREQLGGPGTPPGTEKQFLASSSMLNTTDPKVAELVKQALPPKAPTEPYQRAETLRRFVHQFITAKEMSVGFASASEVARTKTGDCTEHGVLLAALLRGAGIPARVVSGLIYVDQFGGKEGVFGYHMWAQAWVPGSDGKPRWVDFDATLPDGMTFDATHITLGTSALGDDEHENFMVTLAPLLKRLQIKVERTEP